MKVTCVGTDPAALYLGILLKRTDASHSVRFSETGEPGAAYVPAAIMCNPLKPRLDLEDAETGEELVPVLAQVEKVVVTTDNKEFATSGLQYTVADPGAIVDILERRARGLGCEFERRSLTDEDRRSNVLVAADGANSSLRNTTAGFKPNLRRSSNQFVVFKSSEQRDSLSYAFRTTPHGIFHAFALPRGRNGCCIIVETPTQVLRTSGLDRAPPECIIAYCRKLFSVALDHILPSDDAAVWQTFTSVGNRPWHAGNVVLLGAAAYTSHFSIGLDLRSSLEDAEMLAQQLCSSPAEALAAFEAARRPTAESLQRAAQASLTWFEHVRRYAGKPFEQFAFSLLTNSMRMTYGRIEKVAPDLVRAVDAQIAGPPQGSNRPPPPMFAPYRLRELEFAN